MPALPKATARSPTQTGAGAASQVTPIQAAGSVQKPSWQMKPRAAQLVRTTLYPQLPSEQSPGSVETTETVPSHVAAGGASQLTPAQRSGGRQRPETHSSPVAEQSISVGVVYSQARVRGLQAPTKVWAIAPSQVAPIGALQTTPAQGSPGRI